MTFLKHVLIITAIVFAVVGVSAFLGHATDAGLVGVIIAVGIYAEHFIKGNT